MTMDWDRGREWNGQEHAQSADPVEGDGPEETLFRNPESRFDANDPIGSASEEERTRAERLKLWLASA